ncbi:MAG: ATP-binding cassette domain-containing protein [Pseudomonadota bacterium]
MNTANDDTGAPVVVRNLVSQYGQTRIHDDISFAVEQGEIFVIMGSSGSGKTTLLRHLIGLAEPTSGHIELLGRSIFDISRAELIDLRKKIGVAFQSGALINSMSVADNIELPLKQHTKLDPATIRIMCRLKLELMNLSGAEDYMPAQLSGGMLKRAGLARAVITDPSVLFFDEPSAGLDPVTAVELDQLILRLRDSLSMTIIVITHELESALKIADRIMVIGDGKIRAIGNVDEIRRSEDPAVQALLARRAMSDGIDAETYLSRLTGETSDD